MPASLLVTVDTEEEGLWGGAYRAHGNTVRNVEGTRRFQVLCERFGIRPTYLVDTPVVENDAAVALLGGYLERGACEVGGHLHPWCAPPFGEALTRRNSFLCNLPESAQREKLGRLTDRIEVRFGVRPRSFRAGRYGMGDTGARILSELRYTVDSSVIPFSDFSGEGGPDFSRAPYLPYRVGAGGLLSADDSGELLELPVSVGFSHRYFGLARRLRALAARTPGVRRLRAVGALDRLGVARRIKFSPEQASARRMTQLVAAYLARGAPCLVMLLHSSSLIPGFSPYVKDRNALESLFRDLESTFEYCLQERGMVGQTLAEFASQKGHPAPHRGAPRPLQR